MAIHVHVHRVKGRDAETPAILRAQLRETQSKLLDAEMAQRAATERIAKLKKKIGELQVELKSAEQGNASGETWNREGTKKIRVSIPGKDANPDGTISANEGRDMAVLVSKAERVARELVARGREIGGPFRGPGNAVQVREALKRGAA